MIQACKSLSDYLNDNARKMDIFLSLLFSEERIFFYDKRAVFSRKSHLW
jgi:hypothetical protein